MAKDVRLLQQILTAIAHGGRSRAGGTCALTGTAGDDRGVICVWEFWAVAHEHVAWTDYLRPNRDEAAKRAYLASQVSRTI